MDARPRPTASPPYSVAQSAPHQILVCKACKLAYPIRDDIPVMLEEEARQLSHDEAAG